MTQSPAPLPRADAEALEAALPDIPFGPAFIDAYRKHYLAWGKQCFAAGAQAAPQASAEATALRSALSVLERTASECWRIGERKTDEWDALGAALGIARGVLKSAPAGQVPEGADVALPSPVGIVNPHWEPDQAIYTYQDLMRYGHACHEAGRQQRGGEAPDRDAVDLARCGMELHSPGMSEYIVCAELVRIAEARAALAAQPADRRQRCVVQESAHTDADDRMPGSVDANDREAWHADMIAAGATHLGGDFWEWEQENFAYALWKVAIERQQRGGDVKPVAPDDETITESWISASNVDGIAYDGPSFERGYRAGEASRRDRAALAAQPATLQRHGVTV